MAEDVAGATGSILGEPTTTAEAAAATAAASAKVADEATVGKTDGVGKDAAGTETPKTGAPEKYEAFKVEEGFALDAASVEAFLPVAKKLNLTQEQAQELVDLQSQYAKAAAEAEMKVWDKMQEDWANAARSDKEFGGVKFKENIALAHKAIDQFGGKALKEALDATGTGNHPEFIRLFYNIGKALSEDKFHVQNAQSGAPAPKDLAERIFPNHPKAQGA